MERDVTDVDSSSFRHAERLNRAIEVLVIERVLIVPDASIGAGHFVTHKPDTIVARIGFDLINRRAGPGFNGWLLSYGIAYGLKTEWRIDSGYCELLIRSVIIHVALGRMTLAPDAFIRDDVIGFGKILRSHV
jgi:hypothetical protein